MKRTAGRLSSAVPPTNHPTGPSRSLAPQFETSRFATMTEREQQGLPSKAIHLLIVCIWQIQELVIRTFSIFNYYSVLFIITAIRPAGKSFLPPATLHGQHALRRNDC